jgi:4-carboxymuconolactone decarboxylase
MLTALGRERELAVHVKGALTNGVTAEEIREALLQAAVYCGLPAALDAQRTAEQVLREQGVACGEDRVETDATGLDGADGHRR